MRRTYPFNSVRNGAARRRRAFTLLEVMFASSISTIVFGSLISLMIITARQQSQGMIELQVYKHADLIQDRIKLMLQGASREAGVFLTDKDGAFYHTLVFREGVGPSFSNQSLSFDPDDAELTYDPDLGGGGDELLVAGNEGPAFLDNVRFQMGLKTGGIPNGGVILVRIEVSDHGRARSTFRDAVDPANWITVQRSFCINLRER